MWSSPALFDRGEREEATYVLSLIEDTYHTLQYYYIHCEKAGLFLSIYCALAKEITRMYYSNVAQCEPVCAPPAHQALNPFFCGLEAKIHTAREDFLEQDIKRFRPRRSLIS